MLIPAFLMRSRWKTAALIAWNIFAVYFIFEAVATFPHWGSAILDVPQHVGERFVNLSAASAALMYFASLILSATGLALMKLEIADRRARATKSV